MADRLDVTPEAIYAAFRRSNGRPTEVGGELLEQRDAHRLASVAHFYRVKPAADARRSGPVALRIHEHVVVFDASFRAVEWVWLWRHTPEDAWAKAAELIEELEATGVAA
ncbi:MAG: hypothetical protein U5L04_02495 [Trueperaceae bacterium]|nr:hypothetical protein [Trueperaceae bacterium]